MTIELRCFATLAQFAPDNADALPIAPGETVGEVLDRLHIARDEVKLVFVNGRIADLTQPLADGDRVGVFPPVGGG